jgi:quercetin dioxygenase-like cupin family protein
MVEIGEGEVIFSREELSVALLVDVEQLGAVEVRAAPGWGKAPLHVHARHAEALYVFEGELALRLEDREHRVGSDTWAFVPPEVVHAFEVTGDSPAQFLILHAPNSGYGDFVRGSAADFDQHPPPEYATGDPGLVLIRRTGGTSGVGSTEPPKSGGAGFTGTRAETGYNITNRPPERRATLLVDAEELTISEFAYGPGERGANPHVHHHHADAFLVLEGEFTFHLRDGSRALPAGTLVVFPPDVVHGFDNDSEAPARCFNFHMPSYGFGDYLRGRNPDFDQHDPPDDGGTDPSSIVLARLSE